MGPRRRGSFRGRHMNLDPRRDVRVLREPSAHDRIARRSDRDLRVRNRRRRESPTVERGPAPGVAGVDRPFDHDLARRLPQMPGRRYARAHGRCEPSEPERRPAVHGHESTSVAACDHPRVTKPSDVAERILAEAAAPKRPRRIACLTEETVEVLYRIGAGDLVVGVSKYVERPPEAKAKPRVSAFVKADFGAIEAVDPDLVLC